MRAPLLVLALAAVSCVTVAWSHPRTSKVSGRVVAYSSLTPVCLNNNGYWSIVIRVQKPKRMSSKFIRVDFSLPCAKTPEWVTQTESSMQQFQLIRDNSCDAVLEQSTPFEDEHGQHVWAPSWRRPTGAEHDALPFGLVLPCYRSTDLPLSPVL